MLDGLHDNIGGKIKKWAKLIFIVETIGAIITGLVLMFAYDDFVLYGFLALVCGPIVAWVSSWILYAFGEHVEKTCDNESNTRMIVQLLKENDAPKTNNVGTTTYNGSSEQKATNTSTHKWLCDACNKMRTQSPCEHCGKE